MVPTSAIFLEGQSLGGPQTTLQQQILQPKPELMTDALMIFGFIGYGLPTPLLI
jgi:hypothetical protein